MLCGALPVITSAGAMPEVVGDTGVVVASQDPDEIAAGIHRALAMGPSAGRRARERVLELFTIDRRRKLIHGLVEQAEGGAPIDARPEEQEVQASARTAAGRKAA